MDIFEAANRFLNDKYSIPVKKLNEEHDTGHDLDKEGVSKYDRISIKNIINFIKKRNEEKNYKTIEYDFPTASEALSNKEHVQRVAKYLKNKGYNVEIGTGKPPRIFISNFKSINESVNSY